MVELAAHFFLPAAVRLPILEPVVIDKKLGLQHPEACQFGKEIACSV